jgi:hypothetical protein
MEGMNQLGHITENVTKKPPIQLLLTNKNFALKKKNIH